MISLFQAQTAKPIDNVEIKHATEHDILKAPVDGTIPSSSDNSDQTQCKEFGVQANRPAPAQEKAKTMIAEIESEMNVLFQKRSIGIITIEEGKLLRKREAELKREKDHLKSLGRNMESKKKSRASKKRLYEEVFDEYPEVRAKLKLHESVGRPRTEEEHPELLEVIKNLALHGSGADNRRRTEKIRSIKTLSELTEELNSMGYDLSRSGVYLRLLPRTSNSREGKRHVTTAPVKLLRSGNSDHHYHQDGATLDATHPRLQEIS